jgi:hypothetical protein
MGFSPIAMPSNQLVLPRCWFDPHLSSGARKNSGIPRPAGNPWVGRMLTSAQCATETQLIYAWRESYIILSNLIIILYMCLGMGRHVFCWVSCISIRLFPTCELNCPGALGWIGTSLSYSALTKLLCYKGDLMSLQTLWLDKRLPIFWKNWFPHPIVLKWFWFSPWNYEIKKIVWSVLPTHAPAMQILMKQSAWPKISHHIFFTLCS